MGSDGTLRPYGPTYVDVEKPMAPWHRENDLQMVGTSYLLYK